MGNLFSSPKPPPKQKIVLPELPEIELPELPTLPRPARLPTEKDPEVLAAEKRTKEAAFGRKGRLSTILTPRNVTRKSTVV